MRTTFSFFIYYFRITSRDGSCYEGEAFRFKRDPSISCLGVNSPSISPFCLGELSLEQPPEVQEDLLSFSRLSGASFSAPSQDENRFYDEPNIDAIPGTDNGNQKKSTEAQESCTLQLSSKAEPLMPPELGKMGFHGNSVLGWLATPTASLKNYIPTSIPQDSSLEVKQYPTMPMEMVHEMGLERLSRVSEGFPRIEQLQRWFQTVGLQLGGLTHNERLARRVSFVAHIIRYRTAFKPFHAMPAIHGDKTLEFGFLATFAFGRQGLNAYIQNNPDRMAHLLNGIRKRAIKLRPLKEEEIHKLFFWSIILAGAKEWYYREAAIFAKYLWILDFDPSSRPGEIESSWILNQNNRFEFVDYGMIRGNEQTVLARILGYGEDRDERRKWWMYIKLICAKGYYHLINGRVEHTIYDIFREEIDDTTHDSIVNIAKSKSLTYCSKWGLAPLTLRYLVQTVRDTCLSRSETTMGYELSTDCLEYFPQKVLKLAKYLSEKNGFKQSAEKQKASGKMLIRIYEPVRTAKKHQTDS